MFMNLFLMDVPATLNCTEIMKLLIFVAHIFNTFSLGVCKYVVIYVKISILHVSLMYFKINVNNYGTV
jgi:hypothetical protein